MVDLSLSCLMSPKGKNAHSIPMLPSINPIYDRLRPITSHYHPGTIDMHHGGIFHTSGDDPWIQLGLWLFHIYIYTYTHIAHMSYRVGYIGIYSIVSFLILLFFFCGLMNAASNWVCLPSYRTGRHWEGRGLNYICQGFQRLNEYMDRGAVFFVIWP